MKILVLVKRVPDTGVPIKVKSDGSGIDLSSIPFVMNPYDEYALEAALRVKEKKENVEIVLLSLGSEDYKETLRHGLAMGADRAKLIKYEKVSELDSFQIANLLLEEIKKENPDAIFCGKKAVDDERNYIHIYLATKIQKPFIYGAVNLEVDNSSFKVTKEAEKGLVVYEVPFNSFIIFDKCQFEPRYPSLRGIMMAKSKKMDEIVVSNLVDKKIETLKFESPPARKAGKIINLPFPDNVKELVRLLKEEAKVL
ncbi:MAG: electron transfer flavoprotein subunit beta/FixA family protein [Candidatus Hydrothermales bacterium]